VVGQYVPSMMASYDWWARHVGLMVVVAIGEGTGKVQCCSLFLFLLLRASASGIEAFTHTLPPSFTMHLH
jgi:hypothetical protein